MARIPGVVLLIGLLTTTAFADVLVISKGRKNRVLGLPDKVDDVDLTADAKIVLGGTGSYRARTVVLATGSMGRSMAQHFGVDVADLPARLDNHLVRLDLNPGSARPDALGEAL